jgi:hypothetical protein
MPVAVYPGTFDLLPAEEKERLVTGTAGLMAPE